MKLSLFCRAAAMAALTLIAAPTMAQHADEQNPTELQQVQVEARNWTDILAQKLKFQMPEVSDTQITVTKKATVTKLDLQPTVIDNNVRELLVRSPGLLVSEQQSPGQFNLSYRGLGNPQESEYVLVMQDGIPIMSDWIGFPTLYYTPVPQSVSEIQLIRGGSSLLYGPEPAPVVNFVTRRPKPGQPLTGYTENVGGSDGLFSTYNALEGTHNAWEFRVDGYYRHSDGQRDNADSNLRGADVYVGYRTADDDLWSLDLHTYQVEAGDAGRLSYPQFQADPDTTTTPFNRSWVDRYTLVLSHEHHIGDWLVHGKLWSGYQDLASRSAGGFVPPQPPPASTTLQDEQFRYSGLDVRARRDWGQGSAFTVGAEAYRADAPFRQFDTPDLTVDRYDRSGTPRLREQRNSEYGAVFAENLFRFGRFHIVPSVRLEHERVAVDESVRPPFLSRPLIDTSVSRNVPLFGLGFGNDFGHGNETYFNVSQGYRPVRYFDVGSPFANLAPNAEAPDPSKSLSWEAGIHGSPVAGLYYDASLFWIDFDNRIESRRINATDVINVNTGDTRHRGFEGEINYDFLARQDNGQHLEAFASVSLLNATFTDSDNPDQIGKTPAYAPRYLAKAGLTWRAEDRFKVSLSGQAVGSQYWSDANTSRGSGDSFVPAAIPSYAVWDVSADWHLTPHLRLLGGVSNLADRRYYSRVFFDGLLEPALGRAWYLGASLEL